MEWQKIAKRLIRGSYMRLFWPGLIYKRDTFVSARSRLIGKKNIRLGENVVVLSSAVLNCNRSRFIPLKPLQIAGHITIGDYTLIAEYAMLITYSGYITLGSRCSVNPFTMLYGTGRSKSETMYTSALTVRLWLRIIFSNGLTSQFPTREAVVKA